MRIYWVTAWSLTTNKRDNSSVYLWPYFGKPGLTKLALNRFCISMHFQTLRMQWRSFSMRFKMSAMFLNETEILWKPFPNRCKTFAMRCQTLTTHFHGTAKVALRSIHTLCLLMFCLKLKTKYKLKNVVVIVIWENTKLFRFTRSGSN